MNHRCSFLGSFTAEDGEEGCWAISILKPSTSPAPRPRSVQLYSGAEPCGSYSVISVCSVSSGPSLSRARPPQAGLSE